MEKRMPITRRFLIAPSLTRLIRKECGSERIVEGYFAPQSERQSCIRIETAQSSLILTSPGMEADVAEDRTVLPKVHAEALLEACPGAVTFERSALRLHEQDALVDRFVTPGPLDLVSVEFANQVQAAAFLPPTWFGGEVTQDDGYSNHVLALSGLPSPSEPPLSNAALDAVLDALELRPGQASPAATEHKQGLSEAESTFDMLRRLAVVPPVNGAPKALDGDADATQEAADRRAEPKPRRPVLLSAPEPDADEERLAGVIEGLSEALSQSPAETENRPDTDLRGRPAWRWSAH
jgi:CYTH domain-containing protein